MRAYFPLVVAGAFAWAACSDDGAALGPKPRPDRLPQVPVMTPDADAPVDASPAEDTTEWSYVYARYFGAGSPGHCGNSGCHAQRRAGFTCGTTGSSCLEGLVAAGLVDLDDPPSSALGDPLTSPLAWFGTGGPMPFDQVATNQEAARAVSAWLAAGAKHGATNADDGGPNDATGVDASPHPVADAGNDAVADAHIEGGHDAAAVDASPAPHDGGTDAQDASPPTPTWTALYGHWFGPGTPGHCGNSGCHSTIRSGFECGSTRSSCFSGLVAAGLVSTSHPASSVLGDPNQSPLAWFGGRMPKDHAVANPAGALAVTAWLNAGAPNN